MAVTAKRLNDTEPIVIFTYDGELTQEVFKEVIELNVKFINEIGEPIYIIADVRDITTTFGEMIRIMKQAGEGNEDGAGSAFDENIKMLIFVGSSSFIQMYRNSMQNRGAVFGMTIFEDIDTALEAVRIDFARNSKDKLA